MTDQNYADRGVDCGRGCVGRYLEIYDFVLEPARSLSGPSFYTKLNSNRNSPFFEPRNSLVEVATCFEFRIDKWKNVHFWEGVGDECAEVVRKVLKRVVTTLS